MNTMNVNVKNFMIVIFCVFCLTACLKPKYLHTTYTYEPGIVMLDFEIMRMMFVTNSGSFYVPEIDDGTLSYTEGDLLLADFEYDEKNQPYQNVATASNFKVIQKMDILTFQSVTEEKGLADNFSDPIVKGDYTGKLVGYNLIFGFINTDRTVKYDYEMLYLGEIASSMNIYLKARKTDIPATGDIYYTAVNAEPFVNRCREQHFQSVLLTFKTKTGSGDNESDYTTNSSLTLFIPSTTE
jgi:hypothetical protein